MIERYALYDIEKLSDQFGLKSGVPKGVMKRYNIVPSQLIPVIVKRDDANVIERMQWGFVPQNAKDTNSIFRYKTHTVKSEDVFKKSMWEKAIRTQRCLIPANDFYSWAQTPESKVPYYIQTSNQSLVAYAGVYSSWTDADGKEISMTAVVTAPADERTYKYTKQTPVIVDPSQYQIWLDSSVSDMVSLYDIMRPAPYEAFVFTKVSNGIFSKKIDSPTLIHEA